MAEAQHASDHLHFSLQRESTVNCAVLLVNPFGQGIKGGVLANCSTVAESAFFLVAQRDLRYDKNSFYLWFLPNGQAYKVKERRMNAQYAGYVHTCFEYLPF